MKILIVTPALLSGGTERYIINFAKIFSQHNDIDVAYYRSSSDSVKGELGQYVNNIFAMPYYVKKPFSFFKKVKEMFVNGNYDYVYLHANHALTILYSFPVWKNKKLTTKILFHSHNSSGNQMFLHKIFRKLINKVCYKKYACSISAGEYMYGNDDAYIINNGVDLDKYSFNAETRDSLRKEHGLEGTIVFGHIGRFSKQKNHDFLIDIFNSIVQKNSNSRLFLIGQGELQEEIKLKINQLGIDDKVIILDSTDRAGDYYQCFDVFLLPSLYEGLPFVGIEAQASGTPCLFSDVIPTDIAITPLVNFLNLSDSADNWADKALALYSENKAQNDYSSEIIKKGFSIQYLIEDYKNSGLDFGE